MTGCCGGRASQASARRRSSAARRQSRIDQTERRQPLGPGLDGEAEEAGAVLPVGGQILFGQSGDARQVGHFLQLAGIEEAAQGVGHFQRAQGLHARLELLGDHPRHLEAAGQGGDGGGQVQTQFAGGEGRLVLLQIAERADLGQQDGAVASQLAQCRGEGASGAAVGQQDGGVGQGLGCLIAEPVEHPRREVLEEGPPGRHGAPARPGSGERIEAASGHVQSSAFSRASASSRACGSPTCIQSPSSTQPNRRPAAAEARHRG